MDPGLRAKTKQLIEFGWTNWTITFTLEYQQVISYRILTFEQLCNAVQCLSQCLSQDTIQPWRSATNNTQRYCAINDFKIVNLL